MIQKFYLWILSQKNSKQGLKERCVHPCPQKHCSIATAIAIVLGNSQEAKATQVSTEG